MTKQQFLDRIEGIFCDLYYGGEFLTENQVDEISTKLEEIKEIVNF